MRFPSGPWGVRCLLLVYVAACAAWLLRLDFRQHLSTDVLDLIPAGEQAPEAALLRNLAGDTEARILLFALRGGAGPPLAAAREFAGRLAAAPEFAEALALADAGGQEQLGRAIFADRNALLLPSWLARQERDFAATGRAAGEYPGWVADRAAEDLQAFLAEPEAVALQELVPRDPLLLVPRLARRAQGLAPAAAAAGDEALVWARIRASPFSEAGQGRVFAVVAREFERTRAAHPGVTLRWTGVNRFAADSRTRIEREFSLLNVASVLAVLAVVAVFVPRVWRIGHLAVVIGLSLLGAWTVSTLVFPRVHVLVFVIGSLLGGVAIDYGFYIYLQPFGPGESYGHKLRRLLKPLLASCLTTVTGFSLLLFSALPLLRQVGLFVGAGLLCALGTAMLYFAQTERTPLATRHFALPATGGRARLPLRAAAGLALLVAAAAPWRLHWRDDVRELEIVAPGLQQNDADVRAKFGDAGERRVYLTSGDTVAAARARLEIFLTAVPAAHPDASVASLGLVFPTEEDWQKLPARLAALGDFPRAFAAALARRGFTADGFAGFLADWSELRAHPPTGNYADLYRKLAPVLTGPLGMLLRADGDFCWFLTLVDGAGALPPVPGTVALNQLESLNGLFTRYRWSALRLSLAGLALVIGSVFVIYRGWTAVRIALIPAGACFLVFGWFGIFGLTLNLFHLLGAFLGVCLSHNYAIFSAEHSGGRRAVTLASIRLSALCTAASFGVLALSRIPVIHALGLTVALIVLAALAVVELEPLARGRGVEP